MDLQGSLRVQRRRRPLSPKAMYWESNKNRAIYSDYRQEETMKASQRWCSWKLRRFLRMKRKSEEVRSKEDHFGRSSSPSGKGVRYEYDFGNEECGHLWDGVSDSPVTVPSDRSLSCFSKFPITARSPHCDLRGHELLVSSTVAVYTFLPDSSSCVCQRCHRFYLFFMPESAIYNSFSASPQHFWSVQKSHCQNVRSEVWGKQLLPVMSSENSNPDSYCLCWGMGVCSHRPCSLNH